MLLLEDTVIPYLFEELKKKNVDVSLLQVKSKTKVQYGWEIELDTTNPLYSVGCIWYDSIGKVYVHDYGLIAGDYNNDVWCYYEEILDSSDSEEITFNFWNEFHHMAIDQLDNNDIFYKYTNLKRKNNGY